MITRRKFLASAVAAAVAPMVAPEMLASTSIWDGPWYQFTWSNDPVQRHVQRFYAWTITGQDFPFTVPGNKIINPHNDNPQIKRIDPYDITPALYHFDQPDGRSPDEMNCHFCSFMHTKA